MASTGRPWLDRRVIAYAHRGGALEAPASTLYAIERAMALGATGIELDVHATTDGIPVISHDPTVDASSNGSGAIAGLCLDELRGLDHAHVFIEGRGDVPDAKDEEYLFRGRGPADRRFGVATLDEVLEVTRGVLINLDLKNGPPSVPSYAEAVAEAIVRHGREDEVIVTSFDDHRTAAFAALAPSIATAPGIAGLTSFIQGLRLGQPFSGFAPHHVALQVPDRIGGATVVDERLLAAAHADGLAVHVWTINDAKRMHELAELGVDGIMSDIPTMLVEVLRSAGVAYKP